MSPNFAVYDDFARSQARHLEAKKNSLSRDLESESAKGTFAALQHLKKLANHPLLAFSPGDVQHAEIAQAQV